MRLAAVVVSFYMLLNAVVIAGVLVYLGAHPQVLHEWWTRDVPGQSDLPMHDLIGMLGRCRCC